MSASSTGQRILCGEKRTSTELRAVTFGAQCRWRVHCQGKEMHLVFLHCVEADVVDHISAEERKILMIH
jgi:hypothetical protein